MFGFGLAIFLFSLLFKLLSQNGKDGIPPAPSLQL